MSVEKKETKIGLTRREILGAALASLPVAAMASSRAQAGVAQAADKTGGFPQGFLWGAATAAYQVEGNNVGSDGWLLEHVTPTVYTEPSGDACDHYHRYPDDLRMLAKLGFNTYRFSIEWSRIEPEPGFFSIAELDHYRRMLAECHALGLTPMVTFNHFTTPRWFAAAGGWENPNAGDAFVRFCERAAHHLGDLIGIATTFNEPNLGKLLRRMLGDPNAAPEVKSMLQAAARAAGSDRFMTASYCDFDKMQDMMIASHHRARAAMKSGPGDYPVGINLAIADEQPVGPGAAEKIAEIRADLYGAWFEAASLSDFIGVQAYTRTRVDKNGFLAPEPGVELTQLHYEYWPESLEGAIRYTASATKVPIYITENGVGTTDDRRRVAFLYRALAGLHKCVHDGIDVRGYVHWSLLDNFEWTLGYQGTFGLIAVDRATQKRTIKPSARVLGDIARRNSL